MFWDLSYFVLWWCAFVSIVVELLFSFRWNGELVSRLQRSGATGKWALKTKSKHLRWTSNRAGSKILEYMYFPVKFALDEADVYYWQLPTVLSNQVYNISCFWPGWRQSYFWEVKINSQPVREAETFHSQQIGTPTASLLSFIYSGVPISMVCQLLNLRETNIYLTQNDSGPKRTLDEYED